MPEGGRKRKIRAFSPSPAGGGACGLGVGKRGPGLDQLRELGLSAPGGPGSRRHGRLHHLHRAVYSLVPRDCSAAMAFTWQPSWRAARAPCSRTAPPRRCTGSKSRRDQDRRHGAHRAGRRRHAGIASTARPPSPPPTPPSSTTSPVRPSPGRCSTWPRYRPALAERAFDQAEVMQVFDLRAIQDQLERNPTRPAPRSCRPSSTSTTSAVR